MVVVTTKEKLLDFLGHASDNYHVGFAALSLLENDQAKSLLSELTYEVEGHQFDFLYLSGALQTPWAQEIILREFRKMCLRTFHNEVFEIVKGYCERTNQKKALWDQPWYHFARFLRNALSHQGYFTWFDDDEKWLPASWKGKTIKKEMKGTYADTTLFGYKDALDMYEEVRNFVAHGLA
ncbi:MAG TPA: hypothetical protein VGE45_01740 [Chloroflexia bacterium]|jgi:hypothetical protein